MDIQCRTCHARFPATLKPCGMVSRGVGAGTLESALRCWPGGRVLELAVPCGHGEYRGEIEGVDEPRRWAWEWWDTAALTQEAARLEYAREHPRPPEAPWDPPPLWFTCYCGATMRLEGTDSDWGGGLFEGWRGRCTQCGGRVLLSEGGDVGNRYRQEREARYRQVNRQWYQERPAAPRPQMVSALVESVTEATRDE